MLKCPVALLLTVAFVATSHAGAQVQVRARAKPTLVVDRLVFKDLNANGKLDPYEDWRLPVATRVRDLASRMTLEEKAGSCSSTRSMRKRADASPTAACG